MYLSVIFQVHPAAITFITDCHLPSVCCVVGCLPAVVTILSIKWLYYSYTMDYEKDSSAKNVTIIINGDRIDGKN